MITNLLKTRQLGRGRKASFKQLTLPLTKRFLFFMIMSKLIMGDRELVFKFLNSRLNPRLYNNLDKNSDN